MRRASPKKLDRQQNKKTGETVSDKSNDLRYIKTERAIRRAFHELLQEKDMKRITVRELVERAEINKTTFYCHYETLPDLIDTLEKEKINYIIDNLDEVHLLYEDSDRFIDNLYRNLKDCQISEISRHGASGNDFIGRLKEALSREATDRGLNAEDYRNTTTLLIFILHGLLGVMNSGDNINNGINLIKSFIRSGMKKAKNYTNSSLSSLVY